MVIDPILLVAVPLGVAFLLPLFSKLGRTAATAVQGLTIVFTALVAVSWLPGLLDGSLAPANILTGGYDAPIAINLHFGLTEAVLCLLASLTALGSLSYLSVREDEHTIGRSGLLQLLIMTGAFGLIMTRDLFNLFVFLEIASIGTYALVAFGKEETSLEAGFKYMLTGAVASIFLLIGIAFLYKLTGTLNIDDMVGRMPPAATAGLATVILFLLMGMAIELKLLPVNGPALDLYDGADPGVMALLVGTVVNGVLFAFWKIALLVPGTWDTAIMTLGMVTFVGSNLLAVAQDRPRRMLGYSSSAQIGLLVFLVPLVQQGTVALAGAGLLLINHTLAKSGLLWLSGKHAGETRREWTGAFAGSVVMRTALIIFILAITGLPPFPGFWGKWQVLSDLMAGGYGWWALPLLIGSLLEFVYYYGWYRYVRTPATSNVSARPLGGASDLGGVVAFALAALVFGVWLMRDLPVMGDRVLVFLTGVGLVLTLLRRLPRVVLAATATAALGLAAWIMATGGGFDLTTPSGLFHLLIIGAGLLVSIAGLAGSSGTGERFHGLFLIMIASLLLLVSTDNLLLFFVAWEVMTWTSYLVVTSGRLGAKPGQLYMVFSGAAGFLLLGGFMLAIGAGHTTITGLGLLTGSTAAWTWGLLVTGFLGKSAAWGLHIWAPGAYSEAPDLFTPFLSGVISKIPMFGIAMVAFRIAAGNLPAIGAVDLTWLLALIGGLTAFGLTLAAVFQEDAKKLLAYSSVGQVGYIVVGLAILTPLGWTAAMFHVVHHLLFKGLLFLAIAGVIMRTGTRTMYEMGGLIKRMPVSFISVLIGIIALSGVPPLAGFTGKWLLYQALLAKGWLFILVLMMFSSVVAFIYMFRLIHSVFLGQLKPRHRDIKEAPLPLVISEVLMIAGVMALAVFPQLLLNPLNAMMHTQFGLDALRIDGTVLTTMSGHTLNATGMMVLVLVMFVAMFLVLLLVSPPMRKIRQLDIGFAGEVPPPAEEIHFASRFAQPYERAWAPFLKPRATNFWRSVTENTGGVIEAVRKIYSGNGQTYVLYPVLLVVVFALLGLGR